jgi:hypothetical protein
VCGFDNQFESQLPSTFADRVCTPLTTCTDTQWESTAKTLTSDRVCTDHTTCIVPADIHAAGEYVSKIEGTHHDRECASLKLCDYPNEYMSSAPGSNSDRVCTALTTCTLTQWETVPKTHTSDRSCRAHTICQEGEHEFQHATGFVDRVCKNCMPGTFQPAKAQLACKMCDRGKYQQEERQTSCAPCDTDMYQPDRGQDGCNTCDYTCAAGQFHSPCGGFVSGKCLSCPFGQFKAAAGTDSCSACPAGMFQDAMGQDSCKSCDGFHNYQPNEGQRGCIAATTCKANEWQTKGTTTASDRECTPHTICSGTQWETKVSGTHHDRECTEHTICTKHKQWETKAAGTHHDRECKDHTICKDKEWEITYAGTHNDRACTMQQLCHHTTCRMHNGRVLVHHNKADHTFGFTHHRCRYFRDTDNCRCLCHNKKLDDDVLFYAFNDHKRFFWKKSTQTVNIKVGTGCGGGMQYSPSGAQAPSELSQCRSDTLGHTVSVHEGTAFVGGASAQANGLVEFRNDRLSFMGLDSSCTGHAWTGTQAVEATVYTCVQAACAHPGCCDCGNSQCNTGKAQNMCATKHCSTHAHTTLKALPWIAARDLCRAKGQELVKSKQLCPDGIAPLGGALPTSGDFGWIPVANKGNGEYMYIGQPVPDYEGRGHTLRTCSLHHKVPGNEHCCRGGVGLPTWSYDHSADIHKAKQVFCRSCSTTKKTKCPVPTCAAPAAGCRYEPSSEKNADGCLTNPCGRLECRIAAPPGQTCYTHRYITVGTKTWSESKAICRTHGQTLVTAEELCPNGYQSTPPIGIITRSGMATPLDQRPGSKAWVPVAGEDTYDYVYMGADKPDAEGDGRTLKACTRYTQFPAYHGAVPAWAETHDQDLRKGDVVYCRKCRITSFGAQ